MKLTFLGTGTSQGVPVITCSCPICKSDSPKDKRLRTSLHIETEEVSICIDAGPDFRTQILRENINTLDAVLLTHAHHDHVAGLDDVRAFNFSQKKPMPVYGNTDTINQISRYFNYAFDINKYPGTPEIELQIITEKKFTVKNIEFTPLAVIHGKIPILGFMFQEIAYITDASCIPESTLNAIQSCKILIINALRRRQHHSHFSLQEALEISKLINAEKTYLTHLSHQIGLYEEVMNELPENIELAYDGLSLTV